jgi:hypothetical protein
MTSYPTCCLVVPSSNTRATAGFCFITTSARRTFAGNGLGQKSSRCPATPSHVGAKFQAVRADCAPFFNPARPCFASPTACAGVARSGSPTSWTCRSRKCRSIHFQSSMPQKSTLGPTNSTPNSHPSRRCVPFHTTTPPAVRRVETCVGRRAVAFGFLSDSRAGSHSR